jgi:hypothetical protein
MQELVKSRVDVVECCFLVRDLREIVLALRDGADDENDLLLVAAANRPFPINTIQLAPLAETEDRIGTLFSWCFFPSLSA